MEFEQRFKDILPQQPHGLFGPKSLQCLRINTLKISLEKALRLLSEHNINVQKVHFCPYAVLVPRDHKIGPPCADFLYPQALESLLPVLALDPKPGERVLDLCAAPGSKASQIAMHLCNKGLLKANEPVRARLYKLKSVLRLTGAEAEVSSIDGRRFRSPALFDRVLVDAPCSSEGRFRLDDPKTFAYWSVRKIKEMSHKQKGLLLNAGRCLVPGGVLVYSTCTFAPEENEEVVDWFLRKTNGKFQLEPVRMEGINTYPCLSAWQKRVFDRQVAQAMRVLPDECTDGFFIAKFVNSHYK